jgi:SAM-dependent methyltransferase
MCVTVARVSDRPPLTPDAFDSVFREAAHSVAGAVRDCGSPGRSARSTKVSPRHAESHPAISCIDAIQLMPHPDAVMGEVRRLLRPGARAVFSTWEEPDRLRDLAARFESTGLTTIAVEARPEWLARERAIIERALVDAPEFPEDESLQSLAAEAKEVLPLVDKAHRVLGVAQRPHTL